MQTQTAISAANVLLQKAESVFPKQKKVLAVTEFKHAMVSSKRRSKAQQEEEGIFTLEFLFCMRNKKDNELVLEKENSVEVHLIA